MSGELVCQVARSWVDLGSFYTHLVVRFVNFTASVRNIFDTHSCDKVRETQENMKHQTGQPIDRHVHDVILKSLQNLALCLT
jgi:uncharacterized protein YcbK (DUF882 family)